MLLRRAPNICYDLTPFTGKRFPGVDVGDIDGCPEMCIFFKPALSLDLNHAFHPIMWLDGYWVL